MSDFNLGGYAFGNPKLGNTHKIEEFISPDQTIAFNTVPSMAHGLSKKPQIIQTYLRCITTDAGYTAGEVIQIGNENWTSNAANQPHGATVYLPDDEHINVAYGDGNAGQVFVAINPSTGEITGITNSNWRMFVKAYAITLGDIPDITRVGSKVLEEVTVSSGDADVVFNLQQYANEYDSFRIEFKNIRAATDSTGVYFRFSSDGGSTYTTSGDYYTAHGHYNTTSILQQGVTNSFLMTYYGTGTNSDQERSTGFCELLAPFDPDYTSMLSRSHGYDAAANPYVIDCHTRYTGTQVVTHLKILAASGNLEEGTFKLIGIRRAV